MIASPDLDDLGYSEDEQEQRRKAAIPQAPPITQQPVGAPKYTMLDPTRSPIEPSSYQSGPLQFPEAPPIRRAPQSAAAPTDEPPPVKTAPIEGPAAKREHSLLEQGPPQYHGWKRALDVLGRATVPGRAIEEGTGLGTLGYQSRLGQAAGAAKHEQEQAKAPLDLEEEKARTEKDRAEADAKRNAPKVAANKEQAGLAEHGLERDASGNIMPISPERLSVAQRQKLDDAKKLGEYRQAQSGLIEAREELARSQNDPNSPQFKMAMKKLQMAELAHEIAAQNLGLHESQFQNKLQEQELVKPSGQTQSRGSAARSALDVVPSLEKLTIENAKSMGPIVGRIARGELKIGNVDPSVAELYGAMKSFYALQPAVHGFRNAEFVKDFETAIGTLERNPEAFLAGIKGLRPTLEAVEKEGKTSHKRIVEGRDNPNAPARPKGVPQEAVWNDKARQWQMPTSK